MIVRFVDIGDFDYQQCLSFLAIINIIKANNPASIQI